MFIAAVCDTVFRLCPSHACKLRDERNLKNLQFCPESRGAIERCLFELTLQRPLDANCANGIKKP